MHILHIEFYKPGAALEKIFFIHTKHEALRSFRQRFFFLLVCAVFLLSSIVHAQDTLIKPPRESEFKKTLKIAWRSIEKNPDSTVNGELNEELFEAYSGKIIRHIIIKQLPYGVNLFDTTSMVNSVERAVEQLHIETRPAELLASIFIKEGEELNPYKVADNERYLRTLSFLQDARIEVISTKSEDSVDLLIITKDIFSIGFRIRSLQTNFVSLSVYDNNFLGLAQRLELGFLYDKNRKPQFAGEFRYMKYNLFGTFISAEFIESNINKSAIVNDIYERTTAVVLNRPLFTSNALWAGGSEIAKVRSLNTSVKPVESPREYSYWLYDFWGGLNIGVRKKNYRSEDYREGKFFALRYFNRNFLNKPDTITSRDAANFYDFSFAIAEYSLYNTNFAKITHIYGFGITEDIPVGYNAQFKSGFTAYENVYRLYAGTEFQKEFLTRTKYYFNFILALSGNYRDHSFEDNSLFVLGECYTKLVERSRYLMRNHLTANITYINNRKAYPQLYINSIYGIPHLNSDSLRGDARFTISAENLLFSKWKVLGFNIGFINFANFALFSASKWYGNAWEGYSGIGTGIRIRNERLVFGTIEARVTWLPRLVTGSHLDFSLSANLRIRYSGSFVNPPDLGVAK